MMIIEDQILRSITEPWFLDHPYVFETSKTCIDMLLDLVS